MAGTRLEKRSRRPVQTTLAELPVKLSRVRIDPIHHLGIATATQRVRLAEISTAAIQVRRATIRLNATARRLSSGTTMPHGRAAVRAATAVVAVAPPAVEGAVPTAVAVAAYIHLQEVVTAAEGS